MMSMVSEGFAVGFPYLQVRQPLCDLLCCMRRRFGPKSCGASGGVAWDCILAPTRGTREDHVKSDAISERSGSQRISLTLLGGTGST